MIEGHEEMVLERVVGVGHASREGDMIAIHDGVTRGGQHGGQRGCPKIALVEKLIDERIEVVEHFQGSHTVQLARDGCQLTADRGETERPRIA